MICVAGVDFWSEVGPHSEQVDLMVEPSQVSKVIRHGVICHMTNTNTKTKTKTKTKTFEQVDLMAEPSQVSKVNPYVITSLLLFWHYNTGILTKIVHLFLVLSFQVARVTAYLRNSGIEYQVS